MDLLFCVLTEKPPYTHFQQFMQDLNSLLTIIAPTPKWKQVRALAMQLWMGEMTWREFSEDMIEIHLREMKDATANTSETKGEPRLPTISSFSLTPFIRNRPEKRV